MFGGPFFGPLEKKEEVWDIFTFNGRTLLSCVLFHGLAPLGLGRVLKNPAL